MRLKPAILFTVFVTICSSRVNAECFRLWKDARDALHGSDFVFTGTVLSRGWVTTFDVDRVWKGKLKRYTTLAFVGGEDRWEFKQGKAYLVFADRLCCTQSKEPVYTASECSPTALLAQADKSISILGSGKPPRPDRSRRVGE